MTGSAQFPPRIDDSQAEPRVVYVHRPAHWEYRLVTRRLEEPGLQESDLNELGAQGWELIEIFERNRVTQYYFKRLVD